MCHDARRQRRECCVPHLLVRAGRRRGSAGVRTRAHLHVVAAARRGATAAHMQAGVRRRTGRETRGATWFGRRVRTHLATSTTAGELVDCSARDRLQPRRRVTCNNERHTKLVMCYIRARRPTNALKCGLRSGNVNAALASTGPRSREGATAYLERRRSQLAIAFTHRIGAERDQSTLSITLHSRKTKPIGRQHFSVREGWTPSTTSR